MQAQPAAPPQDIAEDAAPEDNGDLQALFAEVNNLPADDPLRAEAMLSRVAAGLLRW